MVPQDIRIVIKHKLNEGMSKSEIAREQGIARQSIYNILAQEEQPKKPRASILDPYKDYIRQRLENYNLSAKRILEEIQERGYTGSYSTVKPFVRQFKTKTVAKITERYETLPGEQAQMDWGECGVIEHQGKRRKLYVFTFVLGYSRMLFARFTVSMNQDELLRNFQESFAALGIPKKVLVDNMKTAVNLHVTGQAVQWNPRFLDFAEHHGFLPVAAPPYWPRVKGKVESAVNHVKQGFLEGRGFEDLSDLNNQLQHWLDAVANVRIHGTTKEQPVQRYQQEWVCLRQPEKVYPIELPQKRKVAMDCHFSYKAAQYSVPPEYAGQYVMVRERNQKLEVFSEGQLVTEHALCEKGQWSTLSEHMLAARSYRQGKLKSKRAPRFEQTSKQEPEVDLKSYDHLLEVPYAYTTTV